jgi:hypothetical protein
MKKAVRLVLLIALILPLIPLSAYSAPKPSLVFGSKHFSVYYIPGDDVRAEYVADRSEEWYQRLSRQLGRPSRWSPVPVIVYTTHESFVGMTGEEFGERLVGRAYSGSQRIELDASEMYEPMTSIIGHELTHIFIFRILGPRSSELPLWANEGIAKSLSGEWDELDTQTIAQAAAARRIPVLKDLESYFPKGDNTLAYAVSAAVITYINANTDGHFIRPVLISMSEGKSFQSSVYAVTGKRVDEWERDWRKEVMHRYVPYGWLRTAGIIAGLALPVLAIAAYLALRRRKTEYLEQYEQEDGYSPEIDKEYWPEH